MTNDFRPDTVARVAPAGYLFTSVPSVCSSPLRNRQTGLNVSSEPEATGEPQHDAPLAPPVVDAAEALRLSKLALCEERLGYIFRDKSLLNSALTHASIAGHRLASNERLEFLGDAILGMVVCEMLFHQFPEYLEGDLTRIKSAVVSRQTCAKIGEALGLQDCLFVGKGVLSSPVAPASLLADAVESLVAAVYLDGGLDFVRTFLHERVATEVASASEGEFSGNFKSHLQQYSQREFGITPTYTLLEEQGPDHAKCFQVSAQIGGRQFEPAWGRNKKEAEQRAASNALDTLHSQAESKRHPASSPDPTLDDATPAANGETDAQGCVPGTTAAANDAPAPVGDASHE